MCHPSFAFSATGCFVLILMLSLFFPLPHFAFSYMCVYVFVCVSRLVDEVPGGWITPLHAPGQAALGGITVRPAPWLDYSAGPHFHLLIYLSPPEEMLSCTKTC